MIELSAEQSERLHQIASTPEVIEQLMTMAQVSRDDFLHFMNAWGLWADPAYAQIARRVLVILHGGSRSRKEIKSTASAPRPHPLRSHWRDPIAVIDETVENLTYLAEWLLEDLDMAAERPEELTIDDVRALSALRAIRALLPRLRIVRSNFEGHPALPGVADPASAYKSAAFAQGKAALNSALGLIRSSTPPKDRLTPE